MPIRVRSKRELAALCAPRLGPRWRRDGAALVLALPYPPSINGLYRRCRDGGLRLSRAGVAFRAAVLAAVAPDYPAAPAGRLAVELDVSPPDAGPRDLDNLLKITLDSLQAARVFANDSLIDRLTVTRRAAVAGGALAVRISPWEG